MAVFVPADYRKLYEDEKKRAEEWHDVAMGNTMELRDEFAMSVIPTFNPYGFSDDRHLEDVARRAYRMADIMIRIRKE